MRNNHRASADPIDMLRDDIVAIKKDLTALVSGRLTDVSDRTRDAVARAGEKAREVAASTEEKAKEMHDGLSKIAAERPLTTVALAMAAGAIGVKLMGWMMRRS